MRMTRTYLINRFEKARLHRSQKKRSQKKSISHLRLGGAAVYRCDRLILGGAAVYRCDNWLAFSGGFSR